MLFKKELWLAILFLILTVSMIFNWVKTGYSSYKLCGTFIFAFFCVIFFRQTFTGR